MNELQCMVGTHFALINPSGVDVLVPRAPQSLRADRERAMLCVA
jgi:hypothetical protein